MQYTGSSYHGEWQRDRMHGQGEYILPPLIGTKYVGGMKDGLYHGDGVIHVTETLKFIGKFLNGKVVEGKYEFSDGIVFEKEDWHYCDGIRNRLFGLEERDGIQPAGRSLVSNVDPPRETPKGMFDCGDGFYDPIRRVVHTYDMRFLRTTDEEEHKWIVGKCFKGWDEAVGYQPQTDNKASQGSENSE
ncbi:predicted protein [Nematostella vectensis]|uniref:MORN repeat-containing protein 5 n=1 Tax=Nematostella vectensis TaxID=45351 RepID=A7RX22_NEMVE|nr:predicted protein [Nematostella vectensis]|eukprot:XP_001636014.1 predicted protein [Nematostella vectensis]